jgi:hypothetical protein
MGLRLDNSPVVSELSVKKGSTTVYPATLKVN